VKEIGSLPKKKLCTSQTLEQPGLAAMDVLRWAGAMTEVVTTSGKTMAKPAKNRARAPIVATLASPSSSSPIKRLVFPPSHGGIHKQGRLPRRRPAAHMNEESSVCQQVGQLLEELTVAGGSGS
jgi:hypothetical protein